jgi:hypothetical protein
MGWVVNATPRSLNPRQRAKLPAVQVSWVGHTAGLDGRGKKSLAPTGVGTSDSPAYSESPYRLRRSGHVEHKLCGENNFLARAETFRIKINCKTTDNLRQSHYNRLRIKYTHFVMQKQ